MACAAWAPTGATGHGGPASSRKLCRPAAAAAAAAAANPTSPLPLVPFFTEFRSQLARLEGVEVLPMPAHLASAQSAAPPVGFRCGACHSDRLRHGDFLYVNAAPSRAIKRGPRGKSVSGDGANGSGGSSSGGTRCGVSLLQGQLLPSLFSFHPPLTFQVVAFEGGADWMVCIDYALLPEAPLDAPAQQERQTQHPLGQLGQQQQQQLLQQQQPLQQQATMQRRAEPSDASALVESAVEDQHLSAPAWQAQQAERLAALRGVYSRAAVPLPAAAQRAPAPGWPAPARLLLSSAQLAGQSPLARRAALENAGLSAFRAALSVHLNGLAAAPADASRAHVRRAAAAQREVLAAAARRPLVCSAHLVAAFGEDWVVDLRAHLLESGQRGLAAAGGAGNEEGAAQDQGSFVYLDPRLLGSDDEGM